MNRTVHFLTGAYILAAMLFTGAAHAMDGDAQGCDMNSVQSANLPPLLGTMSGVRLSFPRTEVGLANIHYSDEKEVWGANPVKRYALPTQDSIIRDFFISLNRKTFLPICSKADLYSYAGMHLYGDKNLPPNSSRWLDFGHPRQDAFGLRQLSSDREAGPLAGTQASEVFDTWYFDDRSWHTLISCVRQSTNVTPNKIYCEHYFVAPELKATVRANYTVMADVADWKHIEQEVRKLALSYVVSDDPPTSSADSRR